MRESLLYGNFSKVFGSVNFVKNKQIIFTKPYTAELSEVEYRALEEDEVLVETAVSTISCGTERANITGDPNVAGNSASSVSFPRSSGYSSSGVVREVGSGAGYSIQRAECRQGCFDGKIKKSCGYKPVGFYPRLFCFVQVCNTKCGSISEYS